MAISRPTIVDDSGSGNDGTIGNAAWVDDFCSRIDAQLLEGATPLEQTTSATGPQNNFNLTQRHTFLRCTGAAPIFSGFTVLAAAPQAGDSVLIECLGTTVKVTDEATSTAANQIITPSASGQIVGLNGRMYCVYDGTTDRWRESLIDPGAAIDVAFSAGNFTAAASMTWTVAEADQIQFRYVQRGKRVRISISLDTTTVGGTPATYLIVTIPFTTAEIGASAVSLFDNNVSSAALVYWVSGATSVRIQRADNAVFTASTNLTYVITSPEVEIA